MTIRPKLIYIADRNPALSHAQFIPRWRQHGALGMSMARWKNIWRYVHCDAFPDASGETPPEHCDGVALIWHKSEEHRRNHFSEAGAQQAMEADELQTFAGLIRDYISPFEESFEVVSAGAHDHKLFCFKQIADHYPWARDGGNWRAACAALTVRALDGRGTLKRYTQNFRRERDNIAARMPFSVVDELWFDTAGERDEAQNILLRDSALSTHLGEAVSRRLFIRTNEVVLYDLSDAP